MLFNCNHEDGCKPGIYEIKNVISKKSYIGSASSFFSRWRSHRFHLRKNEHANHYMQNSYNSTLLHVDNDEFMEFSILEIVESSTKEERLIREEYWLSLMVGNQTELYNSQLYPSKFEGIWTLTPEETREKISMRSKQMWEDPEKREQIIENMSLAWKDQRVHDARVEGIKRAANTPERKQQASEKMKQRYSVMTLEQREDLNRKISEGKRDDLSEHLRSIHKEKRLHGRVVNEITIFEGKMVTNSSSYKNAFLLSPDGILYKDISNLRDFAKHMNFEDTDGEIVRNVILDKSPSYFGWIRFVPKNYVNDCIVVVSPYKPLKIYGDLIDPQGNIHKNVCSLATFAKKHKLHKSGLQELFRGDLKQCKGWRLV